ncbi:MAG: efflux RND transporter periplasmic adaptor subunit [Saprospiraceae bacterium]|nr:efflux RND transporter periplasmic adaptor subunit [Saprospiraceae bacterium]MBL0261434.1 efflux RND transporter periplasmic adaptor subunit [Saprospiraceae bacterium]
MIKYINKINISIILTLYIIFTSCKSSPEGSSQNMQAEEKSADRISLNLQQLSNLQLTTTTLSNRQINSKIKLNGKILALPQNILSVHAPITSTIQSIKVIPGMNVKKNQLLMVLTDPSLIQLQEDFLRAKNSFILKKSEYERQKEMSSAQATSIKNLQNAESDWKEISIILESLTLRVRMLGLVPQQIEDHGIQSSIEVRSKVAGTITQILVNSGSRVNPDQKLLEIQSLDDLKLVLKIFERDINDIQKGTEFIGYSNISKDQSYQCKIESVVPQVNTESYLEVYASIISGKQKIIPGMYIQAELPVKSVLSDALPEECILNFEGGDFVFVALSDQDFKLQPVQISQKSESWVGIRKDDSINQYKIVQKGAYGLLMALKNKEE